MRPFQFPPDLFSELLFFPIALPIGPLPMRALSSDGSCVFAMIFSLFAAIARF